MPAFPSSGKIQTSPDSGDEIQWRTPEVTLDFANAHNRQGLSWECPHSLTLRFVAA
jgi:hypothetical protein